LLLSIKQDFLGANLFGSLRHLSSTYSSIDRFKDHLVQGDKLASLGELVASVADQIRKAMIIIREQAAIITLRARLANPEVAPWRGKLDNMPSERTRW